MSKTTSVARTGLLAVLLAMVGFSYSLATSNSDIPTTDVGARALGTAVPTGVGTNPLDFANPFVLGGTDRDLGDCVAGSALTRLVRAKGGIPPYAFTAGSATFLTSVKLQLFTSGVLTTVGTQLGTFVGPFRFAVTVKDSFGTLPHTKTENFRLTFVTSTQFRFAETSLSDGTQFRPYSDTVQTINGKPSISYALTASTPANSGLSVSKDGEVFGVPLVSGAISLTVTATDANGKLAASRAGTGTSQTLIVNVGANTLLSSLISATSISIKQGSAGKDSLNYKGVANLGGSSTASLSGQLFTIRVGAYTGPTAAFVLNRPGTVATATTPKKVFPSLKASVKKFGLFSAVVSKDTINVGTVTGSTVSLPVEVSIGNAVIGSEFLTFAVKTGRTQTTLTFKGGAANDPGGAGQILKVQGSDDKGLTGDSWKVAFLGRIPSSLNPTSATSVDVAVGTGFAVRNALTFKGTKLSFRGGDKSSASVTAFSLDTNKGKGAYTTGLLPATLTGIPTATTGAAATPFYDTRLSFNTDSATIYGIENSLLVVAKRNKWSSQ